jgi:hypothetical protein
MSPDFVPLRLLAKDLEDLTILAAHLQDALLPLISMVYEPKNATFSMLANRFCWEHPPLDHEKGPLYHRVHSGLCFHNVAKVHHRGLNRKGDQRFLSFLTLQQPTPSTVHLICSGNNEIRIETKDLHCQLGDVSAPWPTHQKPTHLYEHIEAFQNQV